MLGTTNASDQPTVGQIWEVWLRHAMRPCLLLESESGRIGEKPITWWRLLELESGETATVTATRWVMPERRRLIGERLA